MEILDEVERFLKIDNNHEKYNSSYEHFGDGYGYGYGNGNGYGNGGGDGSGDGYGGGYGDGFGDGCGDGSGYGDGGGYGFGNGSGEGVGDGSGDGCGDKYDIYLIKFNDAKVYKIDGVDTIITKIKKNIAKGYILKNDFTLEKTYVVKGGNRFAHGKTIKYAQKDLQAKIMQEMCIDEAIEKFFEEFKDEVKYPVKKFYEWHYYLTGSCEQGRDNFVKEHNINLNKDEFTVREFIKLTKNKYGGDIIERIEQSMKKKYSTYI